MLVLGGGQLHVRTKTLAPSSASGHVGNSWAGTTFHWGAMKTRISKVTQSTSEQIRGVISDHFLMLLFQKDSRDTVGFSRGVLFVQKT